MEITVVIPTIPGRDTLHRALASVGAQTLRACAVLVEPDHDREGPAVVRNRALIRVQTPWVAFVDDDDEIYADHLKLLARYARLTRVDVAYPGWDGPDPTGMFGHPFDPVLLQRANYIPVTVLARTETVRAAGGFQPHPDEHDNPCEDWGLWLAMLDNGAKFGHLPIRTWRMHPGGTRGRPDRW